MKREEAETIKREAYESLIGTYDNRANMFPAHSELVIHIVAGDLQQLCALARLGLRVKWPDVETYTAVARRIYNDAYTEGDDETNQVYTWSECTASRRAECESMALAALAQIQEFE